MSENYFTLQRVFVAVFVPVLRKNGSREKEGTRVFH
jgi:hypothetical protein